MLAFVVYIVLYARSHKDSIDYSSNSGSKQYQSKANMETPDDHFVNEPIAVEQASGGESSTENRSMINEEVLNTGGGTEVSAALETSSTNTTDLSTRSRVTGLFSLPPELRVEVFRHLLFDVHRPMSVYWPVSGYESFPAILGTCRLIRREAWQVLYGENEFFFGLEPRDSMGECVLEHRQISDTIQNVFWEGGVCLSWEFNSQQVFADCIREFGTPAVITRGTLSILFWVFPSSGDRLSWFVSALRAFTNFRTLRCHFVPFTEPLGSVLCNTLQGAMTPFLGPALSLPNGFGLEFHPQKYVNSLSPEVAVDWMEYLDGIRLDQNQEPFVDVDEPKASAQDSNSEAQ